MTTSEQVEKAEAFYRNVCSELIEALDAAIPTWLVSIVGQRGYPIDADHPLVVQVHETMMGDLNEAYGQSHGGASTVIELDSVRNPLDILRRGLVPLNAELQAENLPIPERDEVQRRLFPDDVYDLAPGAFIDLGEAVHQAGLRWGAGKAHLHMIRHQPRTERVDQKATVATFVPDLMDQSRLKGLGTLIGLRSPDDVAALDETVELNGAVIDVSHQRSEPIAHALRQRWPDLAIIGFGPHVDDAAMNNLQTACSEVLARSVFFTRVQRGTLLD